MICTPFSNVSNVNLLIIDRNNKYRHKLILNHNWQLTAYPDCPAMQLNQFHSCSLGANVVKIWNTR